MTPELNSYTGEYRYNLDEKGRVNIPARFRKILHPSNDKTFVVTRGLDPDKCLLVMPLEQWNRMESNFKSKLNLVEDSDRQFLRHHTRYATPVRYDGQGRIIIPQNLLELAGMKKEVIIIGALKWIEIWDPKELDNKMSDESPLSDEELAKLAEKLVL